VIPIVRESYKAMVSRGLILACLLAMPACDAVFKLNPPAVDAPSGVTTFDGLIARYPLDELSSNTSADVISQHDVQCAGSRCPTLTEGRHGMALLFDGVDDHMRAAPTTDFVTLSFTVAFWLRIDRTPDPLVGFVAALSYSTHGTPFDGWAAFLDLSNGKLDFDSTHEPMQSVPLYGQNVWAQGWHHVALRWDGVTMKKSLLIDGAVEMTVSLMPVVLDAAGPITFGADINLDVANFFLQGALDEVQIYDRPLADDEVLMLAQ
jgi:Concanavalin A-like lectin/glucanases superfamily